MDNRQQRRSAQEVQGAQLIGERHVIGDHRRREPDIKIGLVEARAVRAASVVVILLPYDENARASARLRVDLFITKSNFSSILLKTSSLSLSNCCKFK